MNTQKFQPFNKCHEFTPSVPSVEILAWLRLTVIEESTEWLLLGIGEACAACAACAVRLAHERLE